MNLSYKIHILILSLILVHAAPTPDPFPAPAPFSFPVNLTSLRNKLHSLKEHLSFHHFRKDNELSPHAAYLKQMSFKDVKGSFATCPDPQSFTSKKKIFSILSSQSPPVWDLRPSDIKVLIGIGDSIMAALHAEWEFDLRLLDKDYRKSLVTHEYRGANFATGGDNDTFSFGHALKFYSPELKQLSMGKAKFTFCYGPICPADTVFQELDYESLGTNAALSGAWTMHSNIQRELKYLDRNLDNLAPDYANQWKLMVVELGFNNICLSCKALLKGRFTANKFEEDLRYLFDELKKSYTKLLVVMTSPFPLGNAAAVMESDQKCIDVRSLVPGCPCIYNQPPERLAAVNKLATQYHEAVQRVVSNIQAEANPNFGAVYDPGMYSLNFTNGNPREILSGWDCFHPSKQSHARMGAGLWNNLIRADKRPWSIIDPEELQCATSETKIWYPKPESVH